MTAGSAAGRFGPAEEPLGVNTTEAVDVVSREDAPCRGVDGDAAARGAVGGTVEKDDPFGAALAVVVGLMVVVVVAVTAAAAPVVVFGVAWALLVGDFPRGLLPE